MAIYDPPVCNKCGYIGWNPNNWCYGHPHYTYYGPTTIWPTTTGTVTMTVIPAASKAKRPTWDETWLACAEAMAKRSKCHRAQVGAVIVAEDQTVISMSYNGPPRGFQTTLGDCREWCPRSQGKSEPSPTYDDCPTVHAEANAIARADFSRMKGATLYVTTSCCKGCAKMLANSGIKRVVFKHEEGREYRHPQETVDFLRECGIEVSIV